VKITLALLSVAAVSLSFANPPWSANVRAADAGDTINEGESCIASDGDYVYALCNWAERSTYAGLTYGRSTDGGATWTSSIWKDASVGINWHTDPFILVDDSHYVHLFCQFSSQLLRHYLSTDRGLTWCDSVNVSEFLPGGTVDKPWSCLRGNDIYVAWQQWGSTQDSGIVFAKSTDRGRTWDRSTADPANTGITGICLSPSGYIYLMNRNWGGSDVLCTRSTDQGATWAPWVYVDRNCTYTSGYGDRAPLPSIAAPTDNNVIITWVDDRSGNWDVLYSRSTDGGATWTPAANLPDSTAGGQVKGWVASDPYGGIHFMWYHTPSWPTSSSSWWSVRYTHSEDYGATLSPSIRLTDTVFRSGVTFLGEYHVLVTDSTYARAIWTDGRGGDNDLFFAQALLADIGVEENPWQNARVSGPLLDLPSLVRGRTLAVRYTLREPGPATLTVFDPSGRALLTRELGPSQPGLHCEQLVGLPRNQPLFVRLSSSGRTATAKALLLE
jgi:hypothetical protein